MRAILADASLIPDAAPADVERAHERFTARLRDAVAEERRLPRVVASAESSPFLPLLRETLELQVPSPSATRRLAEVVLEHARCAALAQLPDPPGDEIEGVIQLLNDRGFLDARAAIVGATAYVLWEDLPPGASAFHWRHAVTTGVVASFANRSRRDLVGRAFALGLFHGFDRLCGSSERPSVSAIRGGETANAVAVLRRLGLPRWLDDAVGCCDAAVPPVEDVRHALAAACSIASGLGVPSGARRRRATWTRDDPWVGELHARLAVAGGNAWLTQAVEQIFSTAALGLPAALASVG